jgi:hypothetical protein
MNAFAALPGSAVSAGVVGFEVGVDVATVSGGSSPPQPVMARTARRARTGARTARKTR